MLGNRRFIAAAVCVGIAAALDLAILGAVDDPSWQALLAPWGGVAFILALLVRARVAAGKSGIEVDARDSEGCQ